MDVVSGVNEKREATSRSLASHYERSSEWLTEAIQVCNIDDTEPCGCFSLSWQLTSIRFQTQTCKRKILEGTRHEAAEPKRMKKSAEKENVAASNVTSAVKVEKMVKKVALSSVKKSKAAAQGHPPEYLRIMSLKVLELRNELRELNLDTTGLKKDLQKRLLEAIEVEANTKKESKSIVKSAVKSTKPVASCIKDGDGDVQMKDIDSSDSHRDSSKMDVDEHDPRSMNDASAKLASAKKQKVVKEKTVAKSFLKSTAEMFSPTKISAKMHSAKKEQKVVELPAVVATATVHETNMATTQSGRSSLTDGLKKTASAIFSASPVRKQTNAKSARSPHPKESSKKANDSVQPPELVKTATTSSE